MTDQKKTEPKKGRENYDKSGKQATRQENRRKEAVVRAIERLANIEQKLRKTPKSKTYREQFRQARIAVALVRGGKPHADLIAEAETSIKQVFSDLKNQTT